MRDGLKLIGNDSFAKFILVYGIGVFRSRWSDIQPLAAIDEKKPIEYNSNRNDKNNLE